MTVHIWLQNYHSNGKPEKEGKQLQDLLQPLQEPVETVEMRLPITEQDFRSCGDRIIQQLNVFAEKKHIGPLLPIIMREYAVPLMKSTEMDGFVYD